MPEDVRHLGAWMPPLEAVALAIAQRDYGFDEVALMGMSAARLLGAVPRALAAGVVAVPKQRPALDTVAGRVVFVTRRSHGSESSASELGGFSPRAVNEAVSTLWRRAEPDEVEQLAVAQCKRRMTLDVYAHLLPGQDADAAARFERLLWS